MTEEGRPWVSLVVRKTRLQIAMDPSLNYEYLPLLGMKSFVQASLELLFGKHSQAIAEKRVSHEKEIQSCMTLVHKGPHRSLLFDRGNAQDSKIPQHSGTKAGIQTKVCTQSLSHTHSHC